MDALTKQLLAVNIIADAARSGTRIANLLQSISDQGKMQAQPAPVTVKSYYQPQAIDLLKTNNAC